MSGVADGASEAPMPRAVAPLDERLEVRAAQRVAAGEDDVRVRLAETHDPVEQREALLGRQLVRGRGPGIAVARQCRHARPHDSVVSQ